MGHKMTFVDQFSAGSMNCLCNQDLNIESFKGLKVTRLCSTGKGSE